MYEELGPAAYVERIFDDLGVQFVGKNRREARENLCTLLWALYKGNDNSIADPLLAMEVARLKKIPDAERRLDQAYQILLELQNL